MDRNAYRDDNDTDQPDAYWRRRVITLCAGLALLGVLAWAFSGGKPASTAQKGTQANGVLPAAAYSGPPTSPSPGTYASASASAGPVASLPFPTATPSARTSQPGSGPSPGGKAAARAAATGAGGRHRGPPAAEPPPPARPAASSRAGAARRARWCSACSPAGPPTTPGSIPRSRSTPSPPRPAPAPSTSARPSCTCWSCRRAGSSGTRPTAPAASRTGWPNSAAASRRQGSVSWNRTISLPGCVTLASSARPGTYQVQARDATVASPIRTFKLVR